MRSTKTLIAMVALLALPLAACSSTAKIRSSRLCTAAGGTYANGTCDPGKPGSQKTAKQMCDAHGGIYDSVLDMCEMPGDK
ncbi:MAG TPA: hypothetical protein VMI34_02100 [Candidatus Bathyarchaeia archaeon]|nr:hypothetical protein [Candidatus Bathyarchaeia archaeon]